MILYDNILTRINGTGGIAVLFEEIYSRLEKRNIPYSLINYDSKTCRPLERYRKCLVDPDLRSKATVFHSTYYRVPDASIPVVTTVHDFTYEKKVGGIRRAVHSLQKNYSIKNSDRIICVSENTKQDLLYYCPTVDKSKVRVVYNGVSDTFCRLTETNEGRSRVIFVGKRSGYKNFSSLVYALSKLDGLFLECVGGGVFDKKELSFLDNHLPGRYRHLGYISELELNAAYNRSLCLVYPSLYEGFGIPILEAMKAGCPVVATNCSSIPEVAGDAALLTETGSPEEIIEAIRCLLSPGVRENYVTKGIEQAKCFSWDKAFSSTLDVYKELDSQISVF